MRLMVIGASGFLHRCARGRHSDLVTSLADVLEESL
jgi:hypothetical protein